MDLDTLTERTGQLPVVGQLRWFGRFERILASVLVLTPALLWLYEWTSTPRGSISAYHEIAEPPVYYYPLSIAAMLFLANGFIRNGHWYNIFLGASLSIVVIFDHDGASGGIHNGFAFAFFIGNLVVILLFSVGPSPRVKVALGVCMLTVGALVLVDLVSVYWGEYLALIAIAVHYVLDAWEWRGEPRYSAVKRAA